VFIRATTDGYPLLRKVLVGYGQNVALEDTLDVALAKVLGSSPDATAEPTPDQALPDEGTDTTEPTPTPTPTTPETTGDPAQDLAIAIAAAQAAYDAGQQALARGDWEAYGQAQDDLKAALDAIAVAENTLNGDQLIPTDPAQDETQPEGTAA